MANDERKFPYGYVIWILILFLGNAWLVYQLAAREDYPPQLRWVADTSMLLAVIAIIICAAWWWSWRKK